MTHDSGYTNLCIAILAGTAQNEECELWQDFTKAFDLTYKHPDVLAIAMWVGDWLEEHIK
ncbi:hypothetical protein LCGC14_0922610 [marine sediment metagenome]|uniref:Uncharacterized protein n=1 Tax=marine sediment metagenome TaxID=412755 RepID=A0A0F9R937_9ZZZZ